jgi:hypothetical protein
MKLSELRSGYALWKSRHPRSFVFILFWCKLGGAVGDGLLFVVYFLLSLIPSAGELFGKKG